MIRCLICGKEFQSARQMHGHLIRSHADEYEANDYDMEKLTEGYTRKPPRFATRIRFLDLSNAAEREAYNAGYRYIDGEENLYK